METLTTYQSSGVDTLCVEQGLRWLIDRIPQTPRGTASLAQLDIGGMGLALTVLP